MSDAPSADAPLSSHHADRPETPDEAAARVTESRRKRRANQTTTNLLLSLAASLGIVIFLIVVVVRPEPAPQPVDFVSTAAEAEESLGVTIVTPVVPPSWSANRADLTQSGEVAEWYVGFVTGDGAFVAVLQGIDADASWLREALRDPGDPETVRIAGIAWDAYDRRDDPDAGLRAYALVTETAEGTVVLYGTAADDEFALFATAVAAELPAAD